MESEHIRTNARSIKVTTIIIIIKTTKTIVTKKMKRNKEMN